MLVVNRPARADRVPLAGTNRRTAPLGYRAAGARGTSKHAVDFFAQATRGLCTGPHASLFPGRFRSRTAPTVAGLANAWPDNEVRMAEILRDAAIATVANSPTRGLGALAISLQGFDTLAAALIAKCRRKRDPGASVEQRKTDDRYLSIFRW